MAIRVSSNTPQQTQASAETFGYIRSYRSPLEGVQAADTGRGLQQAGQALGQVASLMKRKEDEANKIVADGALNAYQSELDTVNNGLELAIRNQNQEDITKFQAQFNALNPENKEFNLGSYAEKEIDSKYYDGYLGSLKRNWNKYGLAHNNAENQFKITSTLDKDLFGHSNLLASLRQKNTLSEMEFNSFVNAATAKANNPSINALSSVQAQNAQKSGYSNLVFEAYTERATRSEDPEELNNLLLDLDNRLSQEGGLVTYLTEVDNRGIRSAIATRLNDLTENDGKLLKEINTRNYKAGANLTSQIFSSMNSFEDLENLSGSIVKAENYLLSVDPSQITDPAAYESKQTLFSLMIPPIQGGVAFSPLNMYVQEYVKSNGDFVVPTDERLTVSDYNTLKDTVERIGDNALREANVNDDGRAAANIIYGRNSVNVNTKDILNSVGLKGTSTAVEPPVPFPKKNAMSEVNEDQLRTYNRQMSSANRASDVFRKANAIEKKITKQNDAEQAMNLRFLAGEMTRGGEADVDAMTLAISSFTRLAENATQEDQALFQQYLDFARIQPEFMQPEMFNILQSNEVRESELLKETYNKMFFGLFLRVTQGKPKSFWVNDKQALFNAMALEEANFVSSRLGFTANTDNITATIPPQLIDRIETKRKRIAPFGLRSLKQTVGISGAFTQLFGGYGDKKILADEIGQNVVQSALYYMVKNGDIRYLTEAGEKLQFASPLLALFPEIKTELELSKLDDKELFEGLMSATVRTESGAEYPALRITNYAEDEVLNETGLLVEYFDLASMQYRPFKYKDNRLAVIPLDALESGVDRIQSSAIRLMNIIPFVSYSDGQVYDLFESAE
jgi:hypothetical protein